MYVPLYLLHFAIMTGQDATDVLELSIATDRGLDKKVHQ